MELAQSMLNEKKLPKEYWGDAVACSIYFLNRSPIKSVKDQVPQEEWSCTVGVAVMII